jgi:hypothetical protein
MNDVTNCPASLFTLHHFSTLILRTLDQMLRGPGTAVLAGPTSTSFLTQYHGVVL